MQNASAAARAITPRARARSTGGVARPRRALTQPPQKKGTQLTSSRLGSSRSIPSRSSPTSPPIPSTAARIRSTSSSSESDPALDPVERGEHLRAPPAMPSAIVRRSLSAPPSRRGIVIRSAARRSIARSSAVSAASGLLTVSASGGRWCMSLGMPLARNLSLRREDTSSELSLSQVLRRGTVAGFAVRHAGSEIARPHAQAPRGQPAGRAHAHSCPHARTVPGDLDVFEALAGLEHGRGGLVGVHRRRPSSRRRARSLTTSPRCAVTGGSIAPCDLAQQLERNVATGPPAPSRRTPRGR